MERPEHTRKRMRALDGASFRFERKGDELFVNGTAAHVEALAGGIVALVTTGKTVQVGAADYWGMAYDDIPPTQLLAGILLRNFMNSEDDSRVWLRRRRNRKHRDRVQDFEPQRMMHRSCKPGVCSTTCAGYLAHPFAKSV